MRFLDEMPPTVKVLPHRLQPQQKLVLNLSTRREWKDESSMRVPCPGVEPKPLASEANVLPLDNILALAIYIYKLGGHRIGFEASLGSKFTFIEFSQLCEQIRRSSWCLSKTWDVDLLLTALGLAKLWPALRRPTMLLENPIDPATCSAWEIAEGEKFAA